MEEPDVWFSALEANPKTWILKTEKKWILRTEKWILKTEKQKTWILLVERILLQLQRVVLEGLGETLEAGDSVYGEFLHIRRMRWRVSCPSNMSQCFRLPVYLVTSCIGNCLVVPRTTEKAA